MDAQKASEHFSGLFLGMGIQLALVVVTLLCLRQLERNPFPISLAIALLQTLNFTIGILGKAGVAQVIGAGIWALVFWGVTAKCATLSRLAREFPDLYLSKRLRGKHLEQGAKLKPDDSIGRRHRRENRSRSRRSALPFVLILGGIAGVIGAFFLLSRPAGPADPTPVLEDVRRAWNRGDCGALAGFWPPHLQEKREASFKRALERYEWGVRFPEASSITFDEAEIEEARITATLETLGGAVPTIFGWDEVDGWVMRSIRFEDVKDWRP